MKITSVAYSGTGMKHMWFNSIQHIRQVGKVGMDTEHNYISLWCSI